MKLFLLSHLQKTGKSLVFCWVSGDTGLPNDEAADAAAKAAAEVMAKSSPSAIQHAWG
jgi:ribonuclease HI